MTAMLEVLLRVTPSLVHTTSARGRPGLVRVTEKVTVEPWSAVCNELPTAVRTAGTGEEGAKHVTSAACS